MIVDEYIYYLEKHYIPYEALEFPDEIDFTVYDVDICIFEDDIDVSGCIEAEEMTYDMMEKREKVTKKLSKKYPDIEFISYEYGDYEMVKTIPIVRAEELHMEVCRMRDIVDEARHMLLR